MDRVNERSTAYLSATFKDKAGAEEAPSAVTYRIDDVQSGTEVRADTLIAAASTVEITLTPEDNRIISGAGVIQRRRVTVIGSYGASDQVTGNYDYEVVDLSGIAN